MFLHHSFSKHIITTMDVEIDGLVDGEEMSDQQIETLLKQAEERLRQPEFARSNKQGSYLPRTAKLDTSALPQTYVQTSGDIARADPKRLIDEKERRLANGFRKVEDPIALKRKLNEVALPTIPFTFCL